VTGRSAVVGAGILPTGFQLYTRSVRPVRFFLGAAGGLLWFTRDTPVPDARRMNFAADAGVGAELLSHDGRVLVVGYKFQHLSNGGTARLNPGFDTHLMYVGVMRRRARRTGHDVPTVAR
jgi:lipid A 3-O-deacylase PagL